MQYQNVVALAHDFPSVPWTIVTGTLTTTLCQHLTEQLRLPKGLLNPRPLVLPNNLVFEVISGGGALSWVYETIHR
jgi:hypothetical protein